MAIDLQPSAVAAQAVLLAGAVELIRMGQMKASASDILAQSGLENVNAIQAGKYIGLLGLPYKSPGNRKVYDLDLDVLLAKQETLIPLAATATRNVPDLQPEILKLVKVVKWLQSQQEEIRTLENSKQLESTELRRLTALDMDSFANQITHDRNRKEIMRLRGIEHYIFKTAEEIATIPDLEEKARGLARELIAAKGTYNTDGVADKPTNPTMKRASGMRGQGMYSKS